MLLAVIRSVFLLVFVVPLLALPVIVWLAMALVLRLVRVGLPVSAWASLIAAGSAP
jgi:hypothetical protein